MNRRVLVVTGASAGVGRAIARAAGQRKWSVGLLARGEDGLRGAVREIEATGGQALAVPTDVADSAAVEHAAERIESMFGPIDIWVNDAMASVFSPFWAMTADEFKRVTEVTYLGTVYGTMSALRRMRKRDRGTIIQIGSALAYRSIPLQSAYCGAKHGIEGFTESIRSELLHDKSPIQLSMVQLPAVNTPQFDWVKSRLPHKAQPVPPIYQPEVIADAVLWLIDHPRRELVIGLSAWKAILGNHVVPGYIDRYLARTGYLSQQTAEPVDPSAPNNLWQPVAGDHGARGHFDDRAQSFSWTQFWNEHRASVVTVLAVGAVALALQRSVPHEDSDARARGSWQEQPAPSRDNPVSPRRQA